MPRSPALTDLPLVSKEVRATFDVVTRATEKAVRITLKATIGIPYDEDARAECAGTFVVHDFDGRSRLNYLRLGDGLYVMRHGLDQWQGSFPGLAKELDALDRCSENRHLMPYTPRHGVTGVKINSWSPDPKGHVGDPYLETIFDMSAVPARLEELRAVIARNTVLTREGLAYRMPYPSWVVSNDGGVELTRPSRAAEQPVWAFGLYRFDEAMEMARRLGGVPEIRGQVVDAPSLPVPDVSARAAAIHMANDVSLFLSQRLADLPSEDVALWHDCANAGAIMDVAGTEGLSRILKAARTLAHGLTETLPPAAYWRWGAREESRIAVELGEEPAPMPAGPRG
jgi:hypothetical protein